MKRIHYNKLIRDKIPERIHAKGSDLKTRKLSPKEFEKELIKKVEEEASGLQNVRSTTELVNEIADVIDVLDEIRRIKHISASDIAEAQKYTFQQKGGFKKRLFLFWSSDDKYKTNEKRRGRKGKLKK